MAKSVEVAPEGQWCFKHVESEEAVFVKMNDTRFKTRNGNLTQNVEDVKPYSLKSYQGCVLITFDVPNAPSGQKAIRFDLAKLDLEMTSFKAVLSPLVLSAAEFCVAFKNLMKPGAGASEVAPEPELPWTSPVSQASATKKKLKRASGGSKLKVDAVDLSSPNKKDKKRPTNIDEKIDSHFVGQLHLSVDSLADVCPEAWLDREVNPDHVNDIAETLEKTPTLAKTLQPWVGIADVSKDDIASRRQILKGCRITIIGGRHRQAAYKRVRNVSDIHKQELEKVWVIIYDNQLSDQEIRRIAAMHNVINVGSMSTPWMTRVQSCREWLYTSSGKNIILDDTPPSTQAWKIACQTMYVSKDKDPNTLEPTLQAALLRKDVYEQFQRVGELHTRGVLKDQSKNPKKNPKKKADQIPQSKLGMPLQGLADKTKLDLLQQVVRKEISLNELKLKSQRIKKKQLIVNAFLKHTGEESYESLRERFPLHTTEEKLAQFCTSAITRKSIPQEVIAFFERALKWESVKVSNTLNLHEERDGVYFFQRGEFNAILMEGSVSNLPLDQIRRLITARPFKGFPLVLVALPKEMTKNELTVLFTTIHAANVDYLNEYNVAVITDEGPQLEMCREFITSRFTRHQIAYWVNTKTQRLQDHMLKNSLTPIVLGHWAKDGTITETHCHFKDGESGSNTFCFAEIEKGLLPKTLIEHAVKHFSYEGQWVLDLTDSKDSGIVAAISSGRNCVSLMELDKLRQTAEATTHSVNDVEDDSINDIDDDDE